VGSAGGVGSASVTVSTDVVRVDARVGLVGRVGRVRTSGVIVSGRLVLVEDMLDLVLDLLNESRHDDDLWL
jgi:hypothetical protein